MPKPDQPVEPERLPAAEAEKPVAPVLGGAALAQAARAREIVRGRMLLAREFPRDPDVARQKLLKECRRPSFAEAARYDLQRFNRGTGWTIRMAEACLRLWGNMGVDTSVLHEDADRRVVHVSVTDFETGASWDDEIVLAKRVERSPAAAQDRAVLGRRTNSKGETVLICRATDDEMLTLQQNHVSRRARTALLRFLPGDLLDEAKVAVAEAARSQASADPGAARKRLFDAFASIRVTPKMVKDLMAAMFGFNDPDQLAGDDLLDLRGAFSAIESGEARYDELLRKARSKTEDAAGGAEEETPTAPTSRRAAVEAARGALAGDEESDSAPVPAEEPESPLEPEPEGEEDPGGGPQEPDEGNYLADLEADFEANFAPDRPASEPDPSPPGYDRAAWEAAAATVWTLGELAGKTLAQVAETDRGLLRLDFYSGRLPESNSLRDQLLVFLAGRDLAARLATLKRGA